MNSALKLFPTERHGVSNPVVLNTRGPMSRHDKLIQQTRKWVAISFFQPMLDAMRNDPFNSKLFDGGDAGKAFGTMFDERLAEKMSSGASDTLVQSIVRKIEGGKAYAQQSAGKMIAEREGADRASAKSLGASHVPTYY
jgi:Rod binding domain-containing protein